MGGSNNQKFYVNGVDTLLVIYQVCNKAWLWIVTMILQVVGGAKAWLWIVPMTLQALKVGGDSTFQDTTFFENEYPLISMY